MPTIFDQIKSDMDIVTEESFSPVIPVQKVESLDEPIKMSNATIWFRMYDLH